MPQITTPLKGITTTSTYEEGEMHSLVNLRPKNGALHPVAPRKIVQQLSQEYDIVFVHQNNDYKNWIGVKNESGYTSIYWDIKSESPKPISSDIAGNINSVQQIGNIVSLITSENVYYLFFQNNESSFLGELPELPVIGLRTPDVMSEAKMCYTTEYGEHGVTQENFVDATKGLVNKGMAKLVENYGLQLFDACFIRYAYRLYEGTLTKHSPPILVMPVKNILDLKMTQYFWYKNQDRDVVLFPDASFVSVYGYKMRMHYDFTLNGEADKWKDIIKSVDIFMSQPLGLSNIENIITDFHHPFEEHLSDTCNSLNDIKKWRYQDPEIYSFIQFARRYKLEKAKRISSGTLKHHDLMIRRLEEYGEIVTFEDVNYKNIIGFDTLLRDKGLSDVSVYKPHAILRSYIDEAIRRERMTINPYNRFEVKKGTSADPVFLVDSEIKQLEELELSGATDGKIDRVRDLFLFQSYTGLAYSDMKKFSKNDISTQVVSQGEESIEVEVIRSNRTKTDERFIVPILPQAKRILLKYDYELPIITNEKYNDYLKLQQSKLK